MTQESQQHPGMRSYDHHRMAFLNRSRQQAYATLPSSFHPFVQTAFDRLRIAHNGEVHKITVGEIEAVAQRMAEEKH